MGLDSIQSLDEFLEAITHATTVGAQQYGILKGRKFDLGADNHGNAYGHANMNKLVEKYIQLIRENANTRGFDDRFKLFQIWNLLDALNKEQVKPMGGVGVEADARRQMAKVSMAIRQLGPSKLKNFEALLKKAGYGAVNAPPVEDEEKEALKNLTENMGRWGHLKKDEKAILKAEQKLYTKLGEMQQKKRFGSSMQF